MRDLARWLLLALCPSVAFVGTLAAIAALTPKRPVPVEAIVAGVCAAFLACVAAAVAEAVLSRGGGSR